MIDDATLAIKMRDKIERALQNKQHFHAFQVKWKNVF